MATPAVFAFCVIALAVRPGEPVPRELSDDAPRTVESRFKDLASEYDSRFREWHLANLKAKNNEERKKAFKELRPDDKVYAQRFLELAREAPKAPSALDALKRVLECSRDAASDAPIEQLRRDWAGSPRIAGVIHSISTAVSPDAAVLLREIIAKNPDRNAQGPAVLALAGLLDGFSGLVMRWNEDPAMAKQMQQYYRKELVDQILNGDSVTRNKEAEALYERAMKDFADVKLSPRTRQTIGDYAKTRVNRLLALAPGKAAPEIEGEDLDGKPFKLSEYRGKVVLLVLWASWCGPCRQQVPHELAMMARYTDQPFVLLGVNLDRKEDLMRAAVSELGIVWRNWRGGRDERIKARYGVQAIPLVLVLDAKGIIRAKDIRDEELERTLEGLVQEAATKK